MPRLLLLFALLALPLGGCVDFVDPVGLQLARETRVEVTLRLVDRLNASACPGAPPGADTAVLCLEASVFPGVDRFGERRRLLDDTLWVMGVPLSPTLREDGTRVYRFSSRLPVPVLDDTAFTVRFPRVEGTDVEPAGIRWYAVGRTGPDTVVREPGEALRLRVELPTGEPVPPPRRQSWTLDVVGDSLTASFRGDGVPRASYLVPVETLRELHGEPLLVSLRWFQQFFPVVATPGLQVNVLFEERLGWSAATRRTASPPGG